MNGADLKARVLATLMLLLPAMASADFTGLAGRADLAYYLPATETYDPSVPVPSSIIGHEVGAQHVSHDRLVQYMKALAAASDRVEVEVTGHTYEGRELLLMSVSAPANIADLDGLRKRHMARVNGDPGKGPTVVALGYSVHGNEASGSNASMLVAYHLAAGQSNAVRELLNNTVVLLDPSFNPDGLSRFAQWVNSHKGRVAISDPASREHNEAWPGGRTNHYWFDLNRDWLPAQLPESRARLTWFHRWRPHVLADFHEMGTDRTFFFQPGVPSRTNPLTPGENVELTNALASYHAEALDRNGVLYYSQEGFDDFYYGKGSTYPDIHGSVGILFEQASARGHIQDSVSGRLGFPFAVRNQFLASLSTLQGANALGERLAENLYSFHAKARAAASKDARGGFVIADPGDSGRVREFLDVLAIHNVEVFAARRGQEIEGTRYAPDKLYFVPLDQAQYRMVRALFEMPTEFRDNTFYDVSAWTLPLAFGLPFKSISRREAGQLKAGMIATVAASPASINPDAYAWVIDWRDFYAARVLGRVLRAGGQARVATKPFSIEGNDYPAGSVVIPAALIADGRRDDVLAALQPAPHERVRVTSVATGLTTKGIDLGSPSMEPVKEPRVALVVGRRISAYEAGEIWHLLDARFAVPVSLLERGALARVDLSRYSHILMVDGNYEGIDSASSQKLANWIRAGGVLAAQRAAAGWVLATEQLLGEAEKRDETGKENAAQEGAGRPEQRTYADRDDWQARKVIGGAIFEAQLDISHPLGFGFVSTRMPVFHRGTEWIKASQNGFENVAVYAQSPLLAGFASEENITALANSVSIRHARLGRGSLVLFSDIPAFRAFWFGTSRLWLNTIYFGSIVERVNP